MTKAMFGLCVAAALANPARMARAQSDNQPNLIFSITSGYSSGGRLWALAKQAVVAPAGQFDTVALERHLRPGFSAILGATLFPSGHLGVGIEIGLFSLGSESRCAAIDTFRTDPQRLNEQACGSIQGRSFPTSLAAFQAGLTYQFGRRGGTQPYLRVGGGFGLLGSSFIQTAGVVATTSGSCQTGCFKYILDAAKRKEFIWTATAAAGAAVPLGPGYRFRVEARDAIMAMPIVTGPATDLLTTVPVAPTGSTVRHVLTITFGLDVAFEPRRTHRH